MGNNPVLRNDALGDSAGKPDPQHSRIGFRPAEPGQYDLHPVTAFLADISYGLAEFFGGTAVESAVKTVGDPNASVGDKLAAVVGAGLATTRGEGEGGTGEKVVGATEKSVPSPNGEKGSLAHQEGIKQAGNDLKEQGYSVENEVRIQTPGGNKEVRYVDVVGTKEGSPTQYVQVGVQNKNGSPVSREQKALNDLNTAIGLDGIVNFKPYKTR